jgi:hypothetical protein
MLLWKCSTNISYFKFLLIDILPLDNKFKEKLKLFFRSRLEKRLKIWLNLALKRGTSQTFLKGLITYKSLTLFQLRG